MSNPVVQWQIIAKDPESVALFYRKLFGWKISANNALGFREVAAEKGGIPGGIWLAPPEAHNFVQLFVAVEDVDQAVGDATKLPGTAACGCGRAVSIRSSPLCCRAPGRSASRPRQ